MLKGPTVPIERINPDGLPSGPDLTQVVRASGGTTLYLSGQVPYDANSELIGAGDRDAQAKAAMANLEVALAAAGATFSDVVKMTVHIVGYDESMAPALGPVLSLPDPAPAITWVGVAALGRDEMLIEIDATAVLD